MDKTKVALLIDGDNVSADDIDKILKTAGANGVLTVRRVYGNFNNCKQWGKVAETHGLKPVHQINYVPRKNCTDMALAIDAVDMLYRQDVDTFCIVSYDSDFTVLALRLREAGKYVIGMGNAERKAFAVACNQFVPLTAKSKGNSSANASKNKQNAEQPKQQQAQQAPKAEQQKQQPPKADQPKQQNVKQEQPKQPQQTKAEQQKPAQQNARNDQPKQAQQQPKAEQPKQGQQQQAQKGEQSKQQQAQQAPKAEQKPQQNVKQEQPKQPQKAEGPKQQAPTEQQKQASEGAVNEQQKQRSESDKQAAQQAPQADAPAVQQPAPESQSASAEPPRPAAEQTNAAAAEADQSNGEASAPADEARLKQVIDGIVQSLADSKQHLAIGSLVKKIKRELPDFKCTDYNQKNMKALLKKLGYDTYSTRPGDQNNYVVYMLLK